MARSHMWINELLLIPHRVSMILHVLLTESILAHVFFHGKVGQYHPQQQQFRIWSLHRCYDTSDDVIPSGKVFDGFTSPIYLSLKACSY